MSRLLRANFARLWKSKIFWIGMIFMFGSGVIAVVSRYRQTIRYPDYPYAISDILFVGGPFIILVAAVFTGFFIGTEYSDGTIRNKLIVGQSRPAVYFSNLIVCLSAVLLMHLIFILVIVGIGFPLLGNNQLSLSEIMSFLLCSIVAVFALTSIFYLMSMLIHSKSHGAISAFIVANILLVSAMMIMSALNEPEYYDAMDYTVTDDTGNIQNYHTDREKNPYYIAGTQREIYEFLYDFLPGCQLWQITLQTAPHLAYFPIYSLGVIVVMTASGVCFFCKKDLK